MGALSGIQGVKSASVVMADWIGALRGMGGPRMIESEAV